MPITLDCPACKAKLRAPDAAAGYRLPCPYCQKPVKVPTIWPIDSGPRLGERVTATTTSAPTTANPSPQKPAEDEEVFGDFEVVGEEIDPRIAGHVDELEEVEELDELEEVDEPGPARAAFGWSKLLALSLVHVRAHTGSIVDAVTKMDNAGYDLIDPGSGRKVGVAVEVRDPTAALLRHAAGRTVMDTRVEVREGQDEVLLCTIRRPPYVWESTLEILDADEEALGVFECSPWSQLTQATVWVTAKTGENLVGLQPKFLSGRCLFVTTDGRAVGAMMSEAAYERRIKVRWCPRGGSYYLQFARALDTRPREKLLYLAAALGLDLFATEQRTGS